MAKGKESSVERQLKEVSRVLNHFLQEHFQLELSGLEDYLLRVKDLLITLATRSGAAIVGSIFSKMANILQPFTTYSYEMSLQQWRAQTTQLRERNNKLQRRLSTCREQLQDYRVRSNRLTEFVYMLRLHNVDVDQLYRRGVGVPTAEVEEEERQKREVVLGDSIEQDMLMEEQGVSQHASTRPKR